jgi:hypothetical protein
VPLAETTLIATIDYLERTVANHLRHAMLVELKTISPAEGVK